jgi:hypothetical protein
MPRRLAKCLETLRTEAARCDRIEAKAPMARSGMAHKTPGGKSGAGSEGQSQAPRNGDGG